MTIGAAAAFAVILPLAGFSVSWSALFLSAAGVLGSLFGSAAPDGFERSPQRESHQKYHTKTVRWIAGGASVFFLWLWLSWPAGVVTVAAFGFFFGFFIHLLMDVFFD